MRRKTVIGAGFILALIVSDKIPARTQNEPAHVEWHSTGGDTAFTRYSPVDQIKRDNIGDLRVVWRRPALDPMLAERYPQLRLGNNLRSTPSMIEGILYAQNAAGLVEAFDATTGELIWRQVPPAEMADERTAFSTRGVDHWEHGKERRLYSNRNGYLHALDLRTGEPFFGFGEGGRVDLKPTDAHNFRWTSGPIVVGDVVVVAGNIDGAGDSGMRWKESRPEDVRGFDTRTGRLLWTFHVVPGEGEFGVDTWGNESWKHSGDLGSWCCISADEELGYVYVPLSAPTAAYYGGHRPGDNLFSNSLVALNATTGERVWHFQMVHHDLWEYDTVGPATLGEITVEGRRIRAVMQPNKNGFLYVFDRLTGKPVWPIEERPVPPSTIPGEQASPTQPFPTKPPPFARIGITENDLIDFTPELHARAQELAKQFVIGTIYTPPSLVSDQLGGTQGTLMVPGSWGAGNWNTGAFDPETGFYYAVSHEIPRVYRIAKADDKDAEMDYWSPNRDAPYIDGLPLIKPPWGRLVALDLNRGEEAWTVPNGDGPRDHPLLKKLDLPPLGIASRPTPLVTKTLLFMGEGSNLHGGTMPLMFGRKFRAYDKATGEVIWETELPAASTGGPMTYLVGGKQYIVVPVGERDRPPEWIALALSR